MNVSVIYLFTIIIIIYLTLFFSEAKDLSSFVVLLYALFVCTFLKHSIKIIITKNGHTKEYHFCANSVTTVLNVYCIRFIVNMNLYIRAGYRFRCFNSISILDFYFFITFSEYSFNTKVIDISKKNYSKH